LQNNNGFSRYVSTSAHLYNDFEIVHTPPFADSVTEGDVRWDKGVGDSVAADEVVGEIETDKTAMPIVSPTAGVIEELFIADGEKCEKGDKLFKLRLGAGSAPEAAAPAAEAPAAPAAPAPEPTPAPSAAAVEIVSAPPFADSVTEGDVRWDKAVGDSVEVDEVVGEIETDKTALPIVAPSAGVIEEFLIPDGEKCYKGDQLFKLRLGGGAAKPAPAAAAPAPAAPSSVSGPPPTEPPKVAPAPPGPMKITKPTPAPKPAAKPPPPAAPSAGVSMSSNIVEAKEAPTRVTGSRMEIKVKMNRMRQRIAQRLKDAQNINAMLTTFNEIDMSNMMAMRKQYKDTFLKTHNAKLGFMSGFVKASAAALQQMPTVNAVIEDNYTIYRDFVDISIAVATPKGLVVPVLRDVQDMNFAQIELGMNALGEKARAGQLAVEDMDGGTFTISNGGVFGSLMGTPIINPPQSAILGMHGIFDRPVAINGKVEIRPMMYVALTYDHRLIDGREAVTFLRKIKQNVEDPTALLLDI